MSDPVPICYIDAPGFGEQITCTQSVNQTTTNGQTTTTTTGTATFVLTRAHLADLVKVPAFPVNSYQDLAVPAGQFLALSCANGRMPGWLFYFPGGIASQVGAFTQVYTVPGQSPQTSKIDASLTLALATCKVAPSRPITITALIGGVGGVLGINSSSGGGTVYAQDTPISVSLLRAQQAATNKIPAVGPLYRVTIPADCDLNSPNASGGYPGDFAYVVYNGQNYPPAGSNGFTALEELGELPGTVYLRAPNVADVLLPYGDTLASGLIPGGYTAFAPADTINIGTGFDQYALPIANPFPMSGQTFHHHDPSVGLDVDVNF